MYRKASNDAALLTYVKLYGQLQNINFSHENANTVITNVARYATNIHFTDLKFLFLL